jgi:multiple sugar transport system ATP-binding protein
VEVGEQLGSEIILDLKAGGTTMVASVEPTVKVKAQQTIRLGMNPAGLRFFDATTEAAI